MQTNARLVAFLGATDLDRARDFYDGILGLRLLEQTPFANVFDVGGTTLRVTRVDDVAPSGYTVLGWQVEDIREVVTDLGQKGVAFTRYDGMPQDDDGIWTTPGGDLVAWFQDPDGNTLSLTQRND